MNENPQIPPPPPHVPRRALWTSLCVPPGVTVAGNLLAGIFRKGGGEAVILGMPIVVAALMLGCSFVFLDAVGTHYRGSSVGFLYIGYGLFRFAHEFLRETPKPFAGLSGYQIIALATAAAAVVAYRRRRDAAAGGTAAPR